MGGSGSGGLHAVQSTLFLHRCTHSQTYSDTPFPAARTELFNSQLYDTIHGTVSGVACVTPEPDFGPRGRASALAQPDPIWRNSLSDVRHGQMPSLLNTLLNTQHVTQLPTLPYTTWPTLRHYSRRLLSMVTSIAFVAKVFSGTLTSSLYIHLPSSHSGCPTIMPLMSKHSSGGQK